FRRAGPVQCWVIPRFGRLRLSANESSVRERNLRQQCQTHNCTDQPQASDNQRPFSFCGRAERDGCNGGEGQQQSYDTSSFGGDWRLNGRWLSCRFVDEPLKLITRAHPLNRSWHELKT